MQEYPSIQCYSSYAIVFHHRFGNRKDRVRRFIHEKYLQSQLAQMVDDLTQFGFNGNARSDAYLEFTCPDESVPIRFSAQVRHKYFIVPSLIVVEWLLTPYSRLEDLKIDNGIPSQLNSRATFVIAATADEVEVAFEANCPTVTASYVFVLILESPSPGSAALRCTPGAPAGSSRRPGWPRSGPWPRSR